MNGPPAEPRAKFQVKGPRADSRYGPRAEPRGDYLFHSFFNPPLTLQIWDWPLCFVYLHELKIRRLRYEFSFSETKNKNRKKIYTKNGNVYRQCGLHTKDVFKRAI